MSESLELLKGVSQGSVLGPTLFLLQVFFINELPLYLNHCLADLYADDNTIYKPEIEQNLHFDANETRTGVLEIIYQFITEINHYDLGFKT